jgi:hypothetical protein
VRDVIGAGRSVEEVRAGEVGLVLGERFEAAE